MTSCLLFAAFFATVLCDTALAGCVCVCYQKLISTWFSAPSERVFFAVCSADIVAEIVSIGTGE